MAEITKRIVLFLISLVLIILYLVSATTSYANTPESFSLLSPKQMIKQEISNVPENNIIFNEAQEYPLRSFTFDPIIYFNEDDEVWICGVELAALDYTGTKVLISLYSAIFENEKKISHMILLEGEHVAPDGPDTSYDDIEKIGLYIQGFEVIKNNELLTKVSRGSRHTKKLKIETDQNFLLAGGFTLKEFYAGNFDLNVEFLKNIPVHIPVPKNEHYNDQKGELIENCILELKRTVKNKISNQEYKQELASLK